MTKKTKILWIAIAAALATICLLGAVLGQADYEYCQYEHTHDEYCTAHHVTPFIALEVGGFLDDHNGAVAALAGIAVAAFTATLWQSTRNLWKAGERALEATERAFISVEPGGISPYEGEDRRIACDVVITNVGNLPARHVAWFIEKKYSTDPTESDLPITRCPTGDIVLGKGVAARKGADPTTKEEFNVALDGAQPDRAWLYVWGRIAYHDGFVPNRAINFCHRYNMRGVVNGYTLGADKARYHEHGNSIDED